MQKNKKTYKFFKTAVKQIKDEIPNPFKYVKFINA